jgi:hypothetical protein
MATFKIKLNNGISGEIHWKRPTSLEDPQWKKLVKNYPADVNELSCQKFVVADQNSGMRECRTIEAAQKHSDEFVYGSGTTPKVQDLGGVEFNAEQIKAIKATGTTPVNFTLKK